MYHTFQVQEPYKSFLLNWQKTVEWRLNKGKFAKIVPWDILCFETWEEFEVLEKNIYKSFFKMMEKEGFKNVLPDKDDIKDGVETVYYKFYSKDLEEKFWVAGVKVKRIK